MISPPLLLHSPALSPLNFVVSSQLRKLPKEISDRVHVVQFQLQRNSNLPFHLLAYGQSFVKRHNCNIFLNDQLRRAARFPDVFDICDKPDTSTKSGEFFGFKDQLKKKNPLNKHGNVTFFHTAPAYASGPRVHLEIRYAYFTEADQILHLDSMDILYGIASVTNATHFLLPRRREKVYPSPAALYDSNLTLGRHCGCQTCGCEFSFPAVGRKKLAYRPLAETDLKATPDDNYIQCTPVSKP